MKEEQHQQRRTGTSQNPEKLTKPPSNKAGETGNNQTADTIRRRKQPTTASNGKRNLQASEVRPKHSASKQVMRNVYRGS